MEKVQSKLFEESEVVEQVTIKKRILAKIEELIFYFALFVVVLFAFIVVKPNYKNTDAGIRAGVYAQSIMAVLLACVIVVALCCAIFKKLDRKNAIFLLFMAGVIIRVCYMLYTPITSRQHDTFNKANTGHEAYAWSIFSTGKLPTTNSYQFYHPPLNALIQANFMKFMQAFTTFLTEHLGFNASDFPAKYLQGYTSSKLPKGSEMRFFLFSTTQILSATYSVITMVYALKLVKLFNFMS